jgi:hypothetical protein
MAAPVGNAESPALLGTTVRRSIVLGRIFLVIGIAYAVLIAAATSVTSGATSLDALAVFLPVFSVVGAMGAMMVFTNDRLKGVLEYLISYGLSPRRLFLNILLAGLVLASIVVGFSVTIGVGLNLARGRTIDTSVVEILAFYALPMSYASVAFAATVGMFWTSLSSPRSGITSSVGLLPIVGIAPSIITVAVLGVVGTDSLYVVLAALALLVGIVLLLLSQIGRLLPLERLLSPT